MIKNIRIFLVDILDCIDKIESYVKGMTMDAFKEDDKTQDAVMRKMEIIGEATKNIPDNFKKKYPDAPWAEMARTRDKLIHGYFDIDAERVWFITKDDLPEAKIKIRKILKQVEKEIE